MDRNAQCSLQRRQRESRLFSSAILWFQHWICTVDLQLGTCYTSSEKKNKSNYLNFYSIWFSTVLADSRKDMKIWPQLSYCDVVARRGDVPPTAQWEHIFFLLSIFNELLRHLADKFGIINSNFKGVESSYTIFHFKPLTVVPLPQLLSFRRNVDGLCSRIHYWRMSAKLMGLALYYQGDLFDFAALLSHPLAESTLH